MITKIIYTLSFLSLFYSSFSQPLLEVDSKKVDFGTVVEGTICHHRFHYKNVGNAPFILSDIMVTCGCTNPVFSRDPLQPGDTASFAIDFNTKNKMGPVIKGVNLMTNCAERMIGFLIYANIIADSLYVPVRDSLTNKPLKTIDYKSYSHVIIYFNDMKKNGMKDSEDYAEKVIKYIFQTENKALYSNIWFTRESKGIAIGTLEMNIKDDVIKLLKNEVLNKKRLKFWMSQMPE